MAGIELRSPSFGDHQPIPARHAKDHDNLSPALEWSGVPQDAVELAVLCEDPDAPRGTFTHWVLAGLEPTATGLAEGEHPAAAVEGRNDFGEEGWSGPLPPVGGGPHRYFFRVYAASAPLGLVAGASAEDLRRAWRARSWPAAPSSVPTSADRSPSRQARIDALEKGVVMAGLITLTAEEARALSSLLDRASDRLATYEEQTHQDRRLAEEIREAAGDLVNRISREGSTA